MKWMVFGFGSLLTAACSPSSNEVEKSDADVAATDRDGAATDVDVLHVRDAAWGTGVADPGPPSELNGAPCFTFVDGQPTTPTCLGQRWFPSKGTTHVFANFCRDSFDPTFRNLGCGETDAPIYFSIVLPVDDFSIPYSGNVLGGRITFSKRDKAGAVFERSGVFPVKMGVDRSFEVELFDTSGIEKSVMFKLRPQQ